MTYAQAVATPNTEQTKMDTLTKMVKEQEEQIKKLKEVAKAKDEQLERLQAQLENLLKTMQPQTSQTSRITRATQSNGESSIVTRSRDNTPVDTGKKRRGRPKSTESTKHNTENLAIIEIKSPPRKRNITQTTDDSDNEVETAETPPNQPFR